MCATRSSRVVRRRELVFFIPDDRRQSSESGIRSSLLSDMPSLHQSVDDILVEALLVLHGHRCQLVMNPLAVDDCFEIFAKVQMAYD